MPRCAVVLCLVLAALGVRADELPRAVDPRLTVVLFASAPDIVHPVAVDVDKAGRVFVIESHTHFPPANYKGPKFDRIKCFEDTNGDGKADRITVFYEGTRATMDLAFHPDGSLYVATRNEILRLRDTDGDGKADERTRLVFLETKGDYPHNGLSGLCFDSRGHLTFGMGENIGFPYRLIGADGAGISGGGEGGNVFWCSADGRGLRRVATGFWNPFGVGRDLFGRMFAVDNDPDTMPPCRLLHVVEGADYGYQFRYGRSGRHPFQAWDGQLQGTLPQVSGVGEAPCEVLSYESDGLPQEYRGDLLVTSWADHRVERYPLSSRGASFSSTRKPFVEGGKDFRPVGLALAPDGSLFLSDWVLSNYELHGRGALWHVRSRDKRTPDRPTDPRQGLASLHRPLREASARTLATDGAGRAFLRDRLNATEVPVRAAALTALIDAEGAFSGLGAYADRESVVGLRALAVQALVAGGADTKRFLKDAHPEVRTAAVAGLKGTEAGPVLLSLLSDPDPFMRHAAIRQLATQSQLLEALQPKRETEKLQRIGLLLAHRMSGRPQGLARIQDFLADPEEEVRFLALKWISDEQLKDYLPQVNSILSEKSLNARFFLGASTALARLQGREVNEAALADAFVTRLNEAATPLPLRVLALRSVPPSHKQLTLDLLSKLAARPEPELRLEAIRALAEHPQPKRLQTLRDLASDPTRSEDQRAEALVGLAERPTDMIPDLLRLIASDSPTLRAEALRSLMGAPLTEAQKGTIEAMGKKTSDTADLAARVLGRPFTQGRPAPRDLDAWMKRLEGPGDPSAGRRIFFHPRLAGCARCHRADGRGQDVGPDLTTIGHRDRRAILESILQPSNLMAPQYQTWEIETKDGKVQSGMLVRTYLDEYTYVDNKGISFKVTTRDMVDIKALPRSIMPEGLVDLLTEGELRDLLAYLTTRR